MERAVCIGERIYFRPIELDDIDRGWHDWINDPGSMDMLLQSFPVTRLDLENYYRDSQPPKTVMFAVCLKENDSYIGNARLSGIDWIHRKCQYGRLMAPSARGRGLGTEALILLMRYGFMRLGMNRIYSSAWIENEVSLASNDRIGMRREGINKQAVFKNGKFHDTVMLSMTRENFDQLHSLQEGSD